MRYKKAIANYIRQWCRDCRQHHVDKARCVSAAKEWTSGPFLDRRNFGANITRWEEQRKKKMEELKNARKD